MRWVRRIAVTALAVSLLWAATTEEAVGRAGQPKLDEVVKIEFPEGGYSYTLAEAAKGIKLSYKVIVAQDYEGVIAQKFGPSFREPAGPSGLYPQEKITGNDQVYWLMDFGLAQPPQDVVKTLKKGTFAHTFEWDGRNWTGPSDTGTAKGKPFPAGTYDVTVTMHGEVVTEKGKVPYLITRKAKLVLK
jgi:hypothetical protein